MKCELVGSSPDCVSDTAENLEVGGKEGVCWTSAALNTLDTITTDESGIDVDQITLITRC